MGRDRFDHLVDEISRALDDPVSRYALWLRVHERGLDPENLTRDEAVALCGGFLKRFLREGGQRMSPFARRRLRRSVASFEPTAPTPERRLPAL